MPEGRNGLNRRSLLAIGGSAIGAAAISSPAKQARARELATDRLNYNGRTLVAFIMGPNVQMIDFAGPWEVFQDSQWDDSSLIYPFTVSDMKEELKTTGTFVDGRSVGLTFIPDFTYADAPQPRIIVVSGQEHHTPAKVDWIRKASAGAEVVLSVCSGAFLLAKTGLLNGLSATTHHNSYDKFEKEYPAIKLVRGVRFVDNGKLVTAGGLTSGIDAALHVLDRVVGRKTTEMAVDYLEYRSSDWREASRHASGS